MHNSPCPSGRLRGPHTAPSREGPTRLWVAGQPRKGKLFAGKDRHIPQEWVHLSCPQRLSQLQPVPGEFFAHTGVESEVRSMFFSAGAQQLRRRAEKTVLPITAAFAPSSKSSGARQCTSVSGSRPRPADLRAGVCAHTV